MADKYIYEFEEVDRSLLAEVGGKGGNLGELTQAGLPVPPGFIVTAAAYRAFLKENKLEALIKQELHGLDAEDTKKLQAASRKIKTALLRGKIPTKLAGEIEDAYKDLSSKALQKGGAWVAVRSSATAEDLPENSFAGQQATYLNIKGAKKVVDSVKRCFASLFEARAIYYRQVNNYDHLKVALAVPVQVMINSEASGIMFTADPVNSDLSTIVIEGGLGLGEAIVSGSVTPDNYSIDKASLKIVKQEIHDQQWQIVRKNGENVHVKLTERQRQAPKLTEDQIERLAKLALEIEKHYGKPQDTEFAIENNQVYMVQARPITTIKDAAAPAGDATASTTASAEATVKPDAAKLILNGIGASIGVAAGPVKVIHSPDQIDEVKEGDVLVTEMTTPDFVPAMRRAVAIVTDEGGKTSHAAIVSREMGIPCVVGSTTATKVLKTGQMVTVDGHEGSVYEGKVALAPAKAPAAGPAGSQAYREVVPVTATKVYVNLGEPELAREVSALPADGVGLARAEFIISQIGKHPMYMIKQGKQKDYVDALAAGLGEIAAAFNPRPIIYRATDFKTNEYRSLEGGEQFEPEENNPMIGFRGASRYIAQPEEFALELEAIKSLREKRGLKNIWLMIPFVRTTDELKAVQALVAKAGLERGPDFKLWIMAEVPSVAIQMEEFCQMGIDGVSIGSNDLTQLTLGVDRDSGVLAETFDERYPAVIYSIEHIARTCRKHRVTCSICGQAASDYPEVVEAIVKAGATSVSVSPDRVVDTRKLIASIERKLLLSRAMEEEEVELRATDGFVE